MSLHAKYLAMLQEVAKAMPDASEGKHRAVAERLLKFPSYYFLDESGHIKTRGSSTIADEVETLRRLEPELFADEAPKADPSAEERKYPGNRTLAEVQAIKNPEERLALLAEGEGKSPVIGHESWRKPVPKNAGLSPEAFAKLSPMEKIAAANEATAKAQGWDYSGWGRDR
jgi:hypothetical protein